MDFAYLDIMTREIFSSIKVYWSVLSSRRRGEDGVIGMEGIVIFASWKDHIIRVGEIIVIHSSNHISIVTPLKTPSPFMMYSSLLFMHLTLYLDRREGTIR